MKLLKWFMKNNINDKIKECRMCGSINLEFHEKQPVLDPIEEIEVLHDIKYCNDCECVHFYEDGYLAFQRSRDVDRPIIINHLKSDYEVAVMSTQAKAKVEVDINC
jgi:hypothetical protein